MIEANETERSALWLKLKTVFLWYSLDGRCIPCLLTYFFDVVNSCEHSNPSIIQDGQFLRQSLLCHRHTTIHFSRCGDSLPSFFSFKRNSV